MPKTNAFDSLLKLLLEFLKSLLDGTVSKAKSSAGSSVSVGGPPQLPELNHAIDIANDNSVAMWAANKALGEGHPKNRKKFIDAIKKQLKDPDAQQRLTQALSDPKTHDLQQKYPNITSALISALKNPTVQATNKASQEKNPSTATTETLQPAKNTKSPKSETMHYGINAAQAALAASGGSTKKEPNPEIETHHTPMPNHNNF